VEHRERRVVLGQRGEELVAVLVDAEPTQIVRPQPTFHRACETAQQRLQADRTLLGGLLESFVVMEIEKQIGWSATAPAMYHFRSNAGDEVDLVLEQRSGTIVGVEVKSAATVTSSDFKGLRTLADAVGPKFHRGIVLYTGREVVPFGPRLFAVPVEALWDWGARRGPIAREW